MKTFTKRIVIGLVGLLALFGLLAPAQPSSAANPGIWARWNGANGHWLYGDTCDMNGLDIPNGGLTANVSRIDGTNHITRVSIRNTTGYPVSFNGTVDFRGTHGEPGDFEHRYAPTLGSGAVHHFDLDRDFSGTRFYIYLYPFLSDAGAAYGACGQTVLAIE